MSLPVPWLPTGARSLPQAADPAIGKVVVIGEVAVQGWSLSAGKGDGGGGGQGCLGWVLRRGTRPVPGGCPGAQASLCQLPSFREQSPRGGGLGRGGARDPRLGARLGAAVNTVADDDVVAETTRSEERRVGKECRSRWSPYH